MTNRAFRIRPNQLLFLAGLLLSGVLPSSIVPLGYLPAEELAPGVASAPVPELVETAGLEPKLARILTNYYEKTFSGLEHWETVQSVIFEGIIHAPQGEIRFTALKKKPDFYKVVLRPPQGGRMVMAYDGKEVWQSSSAVAGDRPVPMSEAEARNFMRDGTIGGHLVKPSMKGKQIELGGVVDVDGRKCFEIKVTLPSGQRIRSAIDFVEYAERRQITVNNVNGQEERNIYSDFRVVDGVRFPFASVMKSNGKEIHRIEMLDIRVNPGLFESMFQVASDGPSFRAKSGRPEPDAQIESPNNSSSPPRFGETRFGESVFPEPKTDETENGAGYLQESR